LNGNVVLMLKILVDFKLQKKNDISLSIFLNLMWENMRREA